MLKRFGPLIILVVIAIAFFAAGGQHYVTLDALRDNRQFLVDFVARNPVGSALALVGIYAALVAISFPGASLLTIAAGLFFGTVVGGSLVVIGATLGATIVFLIARNASGDALRKRIGNWGEKLADGFEKNAFSYLMLLRLLPVAPFWLVNIVPALFGVKLRDYVLATAIGIIPGTFVYASIGAGAGAVLAAGQELNLKGALLKPEVIGPILGLAALSLIPIIYKKFRKEPVA
ncbi:MAG: TVP38/TMEM64 family protein [Sphingomonas sp.]|uniref:TVP38/TMEM64 family protein n=1 Tax=Sphingomonas sp. TaxID=28214 RepID=UPI0035A81975|nr:TVP38/TMEM64 family protein [Sphingomonas sp.]